MTSIDSVDLKHTVESELALLGLVAERVDAYRFGDGEWSVTLCVRGRTFEIGRVHRDGWCCSESTEGRKKEFVSPDVRVTSRDDDRLRKEGLATVRYAIQHPDFQGVTPHII
jgi:hypothetical protein